MAEYPAFLFYSSDFLSGVSDLTMEERGQYITLLCLQHQKGALSEKTIRLSVGSVSVDVMAKFEKNAEGSFFNKRLVSEIEKRVAFTESRRKNGNMGGRPKQEEKPIGKPKNNLKVNHMANHMENEDRNENDNRIKDESEKFSNPFSPNFIKSWDQWKEYKKKEFAFQYKSVISEQSAINELVKLSGGNEITAKEIIMQSITNGWKGFFALKTDNKNGQQQTNLRDEVRAAYAERFGGGQQTGNKPTS